MPAATGDCYSDIVGKEKEKKKKKRETLSHLVLKVEKVTLFNQRSGACRRFTRDLLALG
jgi:hypothetical protein